MYFLDSDICINLMRGKLPRTFDIMSKSAPSLFAIPTIVESELRTGAQKSNHPQKNLLLLERFLAPFTSVPYDRPCSVAYAKIRTYLETHGTKIGPNDLLIAATVIAHEGILITGNVREFSRVPNLALEEWDEMSL